MIVNGPPRDERCECCGRHISELKPFGGPGDPLVGDYSGALLIKNFRPDGPYNEEAEKAYKEAEACYKQAGFDDIDMYLISKYGQERGEEISFLYDCHHSCGKSWECRDCAVLSTNAYHEKLDHG
jgi:hypothetical protein